MNGFPAEIFASLKALLPQGDYWEFQGEEDELEAFLWGVAEAMAPLEGFLMGLIEEADPREAKRTLNRWITLTESEFETQELTTLALKHQAVYEKLRPFFEKDYPAFVVKGLPPFKITWGREGAPYFQCGDSRCGDPISTPAWHNNAVLVEAPPLPETDRLFFEAKIRGIFLATRSLFFLYATEHETTP